MENDLPTKGLSTSAIFLFIQYIHEKKPYRYPGDKFTNDIQQMIINLFRLALKNRNKSTTMIIYDNRLKDGKSVIMKFDHGLITVDNTKFYGIEDIQSYNYQRKD